MNQWGGETELLQELDDVIAAECPPGDKQVEEEAAVVAGDDNLSMCSSDLDAPDYDDKVVDKGDADHSGYWNQASVKDRPMMRIDDKRGDFSFSQSIELPSNRL